MRNLVPTPRVDRNGRVVTRHMRPGDPSGANIPAPTGTKAKVKTAALVREHTKAIKGLLDDFGVGFWGRRKLMKTLHPDTIEVLATQTDKSGVQHLPISLIKECVFESDMSLLNDTAQFIKDTNSPHPVNHLVMHLKGLLYYYDLTPYSRADSDERASQQALVHAADKLPREYLRISDWSHRLGALALKNQQLVEYIHRNPDKTDDLIKIITERRLDSNSLTNIDDLMGIREDIQGPLMDGSL